MPHRFPPKIKQAIENDVKKACKKAHTEMWSGFGPITEAHLSSCEKKAILVWKQSAPATNDSLTTSYMVGIFHFVDGSWVRHGVTAANYKSNFKMRDVDTIINREKEFWDDKAA